MLTSQHLEIVKELRDIVGKIPGAEKIQERFGMTYLIVVDSDEHKEQGNKVGEVLHEQALGHGFDLEIVCLTQAEYDKMQSELAKAATDSQRVTFKFNGD